MNFKSKKVVFSTPIMKKQMKNELLTEPEIAWKKDQSKRPLEQKPTVP